MAYKEKPPSDMHDSIEYWESAGYDDDTAALSVLREVIDHINTRVSGANVEKAHVSVNHPEFDARSDGEHIVTVWVTSHSNDGKTLPAKYRGFRRPADTIHVDVRRF